MHNDFKDNCMEVMCDIVSAPKSTKRIRIFSNVFFAVIALGIVSACVIFEVPYNLVTEIINEYKNNSKQI